MFISQLVTALCRADSFIICLQLINELGAVDARLAPEFRKLLAGDKEDEATGKPERKKSKVSSKKKEKVSL